MEPLAIYYYSNMYMFTSKGNKLSHNANLRGTKQISINGKAIFMNGVVVRGDLAEVKMGEYVTLQTDVVLRPSYNKKKGKLKYDTMTIGDHVYIDRGSII